MKGLVIVLNNLGGNFMKQNENILLSTATVKLLTMKELHSVRFMDVVSDLTRIMHGVFLKMKQMN